jgi:glycosyltransferase involved in cell wall biosynthesis
LKILQICAAYKPAFIYGGPTMSVSMLSEQLVKAGIDARVFATTANGKDELPVNPGQPVNVDGVTVQYFKRLTKDHSHYSPALLKALRKGAGSFDVIHIHAWWNLVSLFSCMIALKRKVPVILSPRGTLSPYSFKNKSIGVKWVIHQLFGKRLLNKCHIHVTSLREKEAIEKLIHPKSITVLPNFVKLSDKPISSAIKPSPVFRLLFFSRIEEKKGLDILINALPMLTIPYSLTIAGNGNENYIASLKTMAIDNGVTDKITWAGFHNEDKFDLLYAHDLFVLPSYDENFGNTVIESLSVGTPVLISGQVGLADYVKQNNLGWLCQTSPESVSSAINDIAQNNIAGLNRIRQDAPAVIDNDFNDDNLVKRYISMYNQLITNGGI